MPPTDLEHINRELLALVEVGKTLAATLDPQALLRKVVHTARALLQSDRATIMLLDDDRRVFTIAAASGWGVDNLEGAERNSSEGIAGYVASTGEPVLLNDTGTDGPMHLLRREAVRSGVCVPIRTPKDLLGVLTATNSQGSHAFTPHDQELLLFLAGQAAVALVNARLYQESVRSYERLKQTQERMVQAEKLKALGELSAGVAHDFSNLLGGILGHAQLMLRDIDDPKQRKRLQHIEQAAHDGAETVERILEFTRTQPHRPFEAVDLNAVVRDTVAMARPKWENETRVYGTPLEVVTELGDVPFIYGHPVKLREVLTNLLFNAVDAMPDGGRVTVRTYEREGSVFVSVSDNGLGMPVDVQSRIFDPFFSTKGTLGTGLGLSVAYGIVGQHGGHITVDSTEGQGSTFTLCFPATRE
ncbi:MAG TPA: GAF domain-containing sensor histidine kinase [Armatimonadota bacterium]|jgi:signal transduction histidine kinase